MKRKQKVLQLSKTVVKNAQTFTLDVPPTGNLYWRNFGGRMVKTAAARAYLETVAVTIQEAGVRLLSGDVCLTIHWYRERRQGDLDNRIKVLQDALQGYAYANDSQVSELHAYRHDDRANPRMEIEVRAA